MTKEDVIKYRKAILKEFYTEKNIKSLFLQLKEIDLTENIIIDTIDDFSIIKIIMSNLILNEYKRQGGYFEYLSLTTKDLLTNYFEKTGIDIEKPEILILYEIADVPNRSYPDLINELIQVRYMNDKVTVILFTGSMLIEGKKLIDLISGNSRKYFKSITIKGANSIKIGSFNNSSNNIPKTKNRHIL